MADVSKKNQLVPDKKTDVVNGVNVLIKTTYRTATGADGKVIKVVDRVTTKNLKQLTWDRDYLVSQMKQWQKQLDEYNAQIAQLEATSTPIKPGTKNTKKKN